MKNTGIYRLNGIPITNDGEWEEDELLSLVMDECHRVCGRINQDIIRGVNIAWSNKLLLHAGALCQQVVGENSLVDIYDTRDGLLGFEEWMRSTVREIVDGNRYKHYLK